MTERPILFSGAMVRAILDGRKTQTRRAVKLIGAEVIEEAITGPWPFSPQHDDWLACPFGSVGDRLWVRETWGHRGSAWNNTKPAIREVSIAYAADNASRVIVRPRDDESGLPKQHCLPRFKGKPHPTEEHYGECLESFWKAWRPSIHMPRWASRLTLEVTGVRVERLQAISEEDAKAEGARRFDGLPSTHPYGQDARWSCGEPTSTQECLGTARMAFANLWESINGAGSWDANPWVWVVDFRRVTP